MLTISPAFFKSCSSTSQSATTSTGATWIRRNKSLLPYHPVPINATLLGDCCEKKSRALVLNAASANADDVLIINRRRCILFWLIIQALKFKMPLYFKDSKNV